MALLVMVTFAACSNDDGGDETPEEVSDLVGTWTLLNGAGALAVGPAAGSGDWWTSDAQVAADRACFFDDTWEFTADGNLIITMGSETWLEQWQNGTDNEFCGAPVAPHTGGSFTYTLDEAAGTLTLNGAGAFIGLPKATNSGERSTGAAEPNSRTYTIHSLSATAAEIRMNTGQNSNGDEVHWTFRFTKQ